MVALAQTPEAKAFLSTVEAMCLATNPDQRGIPDPVHRFSPGLYIREQFMPMGYLMLGHEHRGPAMNFVMSGRIRVYVDGKVREITGPCVFESGPGRKVGLVLEDTVWLNVHPNPDNETDVEKLEDRYVKKSEASRLREAQKRELN